MGVLEIILLALGVAGTATNAAGSILQSGARRREAQTQAFVDTENAAFATQAAADAKARGELDSGYRQMQASAEIGSMRAEAGASGVDGSVGSASDAMAQTRRLAALDSLILRNNASREAWGYEVQAHNYLRSAESARKRGEADLMGTLLGGAGQTLDSTAKLGADVYKWSR
jgi:hypothetical protein